MKYCNSTVCSLYMYTIPRVAFLYFAVRANGSFTLAMSILLKETLYHLIMVVFRFRKWSGMEELTVFHTQFAKPFF